MARTSVYFITGDESEDRDEARASVDFWLEDYLGREFYEGFEISYEDVKCIFEFEVGYFENALRESEERVADYQKEIVEYGNKDDQHSRYKAGAAHVRLGHILMKSFCEDMPYWNLRGYSWDLPGDKNDWAVMITLY